MFQAANGRTRSSTALEMAMLVFHLAAHEVRQQNRSPVLAVLLNIMQSMIMLVAFYFMFEILGMRRSTVRGDFVMYLLSGIFLFMTHIKAVGAAGGGIGNAVMQHEPMNFFIALLASSLRSLYIQVLSVLVILVFYHALTGRVEIANPAMAFVCFLLAWWSGIAVGTVFKALAPFLPALIAIIKQFYMRINMIASGKMFLANTLPSVMLSMFDWNPLFHCIDQARGFVFINYNPHFSSLIYPLKVTIVLQVLGLLLLYWSRWSEHLSNQR